MKNKITDLILAGIVYLAALLIPVAKYLLGIGIIVIFDLITGILAARKEQKEITSKKMRNSVTKGIGYMSAILVAFTMQKLFIKDFEVMKIVSGLIAFIELKSIDENLFKMTGKSLFNQFLKKNGDNNG